MDTSTAPISSFSVSPSELAALLGTPNAPLIIDVRRQGPFDSATHIIATAQRCDPSAIELLIQAMPPRDVIVYCVYGHQVSQNVATQLRAAGWSARFLAGGFEGGQVGVDTAEDIQKWQENRPPSSLKNTEPSQPKLI